MVVSKVAFVYPTTAGYEENDGDMACCKFILGLPNPKTRSPEYDTFPKTMKRKMDQGKIPGSVGSRADQWGAIQADELTITHVPHLAPLWQTNTRRGQWFTGCFDYLLRNIAKKDNNNVENFLRVPLAGLACLTGTTGPAGTAAPVAAVNDRKSSQNICTE